LSILFLKIFNNKQKMLKINIFASFFNMLTALRRYGAVSRYSPIIHKTILSVFNKIKNIFIFDYKNEVFY